MANPIDVGFLGNFAPIFILILVFAIVYGILNATNVLGNNKSIQAIVAIVFGILAIMSSKIIVFFKLFFPWITVFLIFIVVYLLLQLWVLPKMGVST